MTDPRYDDRTTGLKATRATAPSPEYSSGGGMPGWLVALLAVLALLAIAVVLFFALGGDADVDTEPGNVDVEAPDVDADVEPPDVDVEAPDADVDVDVDPGDVDVDDADAEADAGG